MEIVLLHASKPETHELLKPALDRIVEFTVSNNSDADPNILFAELAAAYFHREPVSMIWVGLVGGRIVAHLFATIDNYYGGLFLTIHQLWKDPGITVTDEDKSVMLGSLKDWGRTNGCKNIRIYAMNARVAEVFEKNYGFSPMERSMLSMPIESGE